MRIGRAKKGHGTTLSYYDWGATPYYALQNEPRLSYCLYVPRDYDEDGTRRYPLIALIHGTERGAALYRDAFADFAEEWQVIVLAPLFPCNLTGPGDTENDKFLFSGGIRFDLALLDMAAEVAGRYRLDGAKFLLHGFSGGGHFAHRFLFRHPERLRGVSIGAPGVVTLPDTDRDWPAGMRGMGAFLNEPSDPDPVALSQVPVQCVIGAADTETWEIQVPDHVKGAAALNAIGTTRIDRLKALARGLEAASVQTRLDYVPGVGHDGRAVLGPVQEFFGTCLMEAAVE